MLKELIRNRIKDAINSYDWETKIEYVLDKMNIEELVDEAIDETLDIESKLKDFIECEIKEALEDFDIYDLD